MEKVEGIRMINSEPQKSGVQTTAPRCAILYPGDLLDPRAPAAHAEARRHVRRVRSLRQYRFWRRKSEGLYHKDTRYLSDLRLLVNGVWPACCSARPFRTITGS